MSRDVMRSFTNFKNGTSIIQVSGGAAAPPQPWPRLSRRGRGQLLLRALLQRSSRRPGRPLSLQGALTQLIQYYHGFHKILNQPTFRSLAVRSELINLHHLMVEVKKHKPNF